MTEFVSGPEAVEEAVSNALGDKVRRIRIERGEVTLVVSPADYLESMRILRDAACPAHLAQSAHRHPPR